MSEASDDLLRALFKFGTIPNLNRPIVESAIIDLFGSPDHRELCEDHLILLYGRTEFVMASDNSVLLVVSFFRRLHRARIVELPELKRGLTMDSFIAWLNRNGIPWNVDQSLTFEGQITIRTEGGALVSFDSEAAKIEKLSCYLV